MWVIMVLGNMLSGTQPKSTPLVIWPLDLVIALPALFWGGLWLWRRQPLGYAVGGIRDDVLPAYAVIGAGGLVLLVLYLRDLGGPERSTVDTVASSGNGALDRLSKGGSALRAAHRI